MGRRDTLSSKLKSVDIGAVDSSLNEALVTRELEDRRSSLGQLDGDHRVS